MKRQFSYASVSAHPSGYAARIFYTDKTSRVIPCSTVEQAEKIARAYANTGTASSRDIARKIVSYADACKRLVE